MHVFFLLGQDFLSLLSSGSHSDVEVSFKKTKTKNYEKKKSFFLNLDNDNLPLPHKKKTHKVLERSPFLVLGHTQHEKKKQRIFCKN